jgi:hypothetical protein
MVKGDVTAHQEVRALSRLRAWSSPSAAYLRVLFTYLGTYDADERRFDLQHSSELRVVQRAATDFEAAGLTAETRGSGHIRVE